MKIYTKKGDDGRTSLLGGSRVPKHHLRIESYGTVDELNSFIGLLRDQPATASYQAQLQTIQDRLFTIGAYLATDDENSKAYRPDLREADVEVLEQSIDEMEKGLPPLKNFVLPGGHPANSLAHVCRTVCRRAERLVVHLNSEDRPVEPIIIAYLNRLSDWFFVLSRHITHTTGSQEVVWQPRGTGA